MINNTSKVSLRGLRTFCVAARHESFREAADALHVTASAVSHQIKNLELELGQTVFERTGRTLALTETGRELYENACPLMSQLDDVVARFRVDRVRRTLRISVQPFFASEVFVPKLHEFAENFSDIDLVVDTSNESSENLPANADIGIRLFRTAPAGAELLFPLELVPVASPGFRDQLVVSDQRIVSRFPILVHETRPQAWRQWSQSSGISLPEGTKVIRLDSMIAVARAAQRGLGAALIPAVLSDEWLSSGSLVRLFEQSLVAEDSYYLLCKASRADDREVRQLCDWILQTFDARR